MKPEAALVPLALLWVAAAEGIALPPWLATLTAAVLGTLTLRRLRLGTRVGMPFLFLFLFVLWLALEALWQPVPWDRAAHLLSCALGAVALAVITSHPTGRQWFRLAVVGAGLLSALWLLVEKLVVGGRPGGPLLNPNPAAALAVLSWALLLVSGLPSWVGWPGTCLLLAGVVASGSRAAALAAVLVGLYAWLGKGRWGGWRAAILFALGGALALVVRLVRDQDPLRFERLRIWQTALKVASAYSPWGTGPGGFADAVLAFNFPREGEFARFARIPHVAENDLLQATASLGLPGGLLALGLAGSALLSAGRRGIGPVLAVGTVSAFHTQLAWPVGAFAAVAAVRFTGRRHLRLRGPQAAALLLTVMVFSAAALAWPRGPLGDRPGELMTDLRAVLAGHTDPEGLADAFVQAERLVRMAPRMSRAWEAKGIAAVRLGQELGDAALMTEAVAAFAQAQKLNPNGVWAFYGESIAWLRLGEVAKARTAIFRALQVEPNCVRCWLTLAQAQLFSGELAQARAAFTKALELARQAQKLTFVSSYEVELARLEEPLTTLLRRSLGETP